jgi:hypothetical protein
MKKYFMLFLLALLGISFSALAKKVEITDARLIAKNAYFEQVNRHDAVPYQTLAITSEYVEKYNDRDVYYAFNFNNKGFVLISADDICYPVIGFSMESTYSPNEQASEFAYWMNERKTEIAYNIDNNIAADPAGTAVWQRLNTTDASQLLNNIDKSIMDVAPLITSLWDQGYPYNDLVPMDASCGSFNGHVTTGCVATAMAQIMYYWRWPNTGVGNHCDSHTNYGQLCADFGSTTYDWNGMVNQPSKECLPVSTLMYHAGISVNMNYNSDGLCSSGAYTSDVAGAFRNYFRYASTTSYVQKSAYSTTNWNNMLQADLDASEPINYSGQGSSGGHSWVCDGYQATDYYHFNWGWSGSDNGYFYLTNLNPGGYNFNSQQQATVHITPDPAQYPLYCTGTSNITTDDYGTIEDGSGPQVDYQNNANCSWLIAPDDSIKSVKLGFIRFSTDPADVLTVYDGPTTASPVLGTYSGATLPTATPTSTGPQMLVTFVSNGSTTAPGFLLSYDATPVAFCNSSTTLTDVVGSFSDYSGRFQYRNGTSCKWMLNPTNAVSITVHFSNFNTEAVNDKVLVYNTAVNPPTVLATYSGDHTTDLLDAVTIPSGKGMVMWTTNKSNRGAGWDANYDVVLGTDTQKAFEDLSVFPNPTDGMLNIRFTLNETQSVKIDIISLKGETVYNQTLGSFKGNFDKQVDLSSLAKGIYVLRLTSDHGTTNEKIVLK